MMMGHTCARGYRRSVGETGQNVIEFALILPLLLLLIVGIMDFGIVFFSYNTIGNATREGARVGVIPGRTAAEIEAAALALATGLDAAALTINVPDVCTTAPGGPNDVVVVEATYNVTLMTAPIIQIVGSGTLPISASSTMRCE